MAAWWRRRPPVVQDLLAGGAVAVAWFTAFHLFRQRGWSPSEPETFVVAGVWTAATVALRRVHPALVFAVVVVAYPIAYGGTLQTEFHLLPVLVAGYTATSTGRVHPVVASLGCTAANLVLSWNHGPGAPGGRAFGRSFDWPSVLFIELATVSVVVLGWLMHRQAAISRDLAQRNAELERLRAVEAQRVVAEERTRIARELHDVVAHHLTAVIIRAQAADRVRATRPEVASDSIGWIAETAKEALTAMRTTVRVLRTDVDAADLAPEPTLGDLGSIASRVGEAGLEIELRMPEPLPDLEPQVELAAVRIAQEALTNAMRHAGARRAIVTLRCDADGVVVDVDDDGTSGPPSARRRDGNGLVGMQERAAACGGRLRIGTSPLGGWRIHALAPDPGGVVLIRVVVVDDQAVIRTGLRTMLEHETDVTIVGEAGNGAEAVDLVARASPDVVLMDVRMPEVDGIEATRRILAGGMRSPPAVLVLTTFDDDEYVFGALRAGAAGFLLKDVGPDVLVAAVRTVAAGDALVDPSVTRRLVERWVALEVSSAPTRPVPAALGTLSAREREILVGLARGRTNRELADDLIVSEATVKTHVSNLLTKLGVRSRVQAVVIAYEAGVVRPGERGDVPWLP